MANTLMSLLVKLGADTSGLINDLKKAEQSSLTSSQKITKGLSKIGGAAVLGGIAAAGAAAVALGGFLMKSVQAASEAQDIQTQLEAVLAKTGSTTGVTADQINKMANSLSLVTKFDDEAIISAGGVLARFDKIGKETMPAAMQATLDLAQSMGIDLASAATMVGKVLQTPGEGMLRLKAAGVALTDEQTKLIQKLFDAGKTAEAQDMILKALSGTMGGVAQAAGSTFSGKLAILKNSLGNVSETIGGALLPILTNLASTLIDKLNSPETQAWIANITAGIASLASQVVAYIPIVISWFTQAFDYLKNNQGIIVGILAALGAAVAMFVYVVVLPAIGSLIGMLAGPIAVMALVGAAVYLLYQAWTNNWGGIQEKVTAVINFIKPFIQDAIAAISTFVQNTLAAIRGWWDAHGAQVIAIMQAFWAFIKGVWDAALVAIKLIVKIFMDAIHGDWYAFGEDLRTLIDKAWELIKTVFSNARKAIKLIVSNLVTDIIKFFTDTDWAAVGQGIINGIIAGIKAAAAWLIKAAIDVAKAALDAVKGLLGIKSPSTVFATIGENMMEGMAQGITDNANLIEAALSVIADAIEQSGIGLETLAGGFGAFGSAISGRFKVETVMPLQDLVKSLDAQIAEMRAKWPWIDVSNNQVLLDLMNQRVAAGEKLADAEALVYKYEKAQSDLRFLQSQMDFLKFLSENNLDPQQILGGMTLGINASIDDLLKAMTAAMEAMVNAANDTLQTASPSRVFKKMFQNVILGAVQGIKTKLPELKAELSAIGAVGGGDNSRITNINVTPHYYRGSEPTLMDELATIGAFSRA
jgi:phage-related protein